MFQKMEIFSSMRKYLIPIDIIGERQSRQISSPGIISKLAVGIKKFWTEDSKIYNISVINIANNCLEADKSNKIVESSVLVTKAADAITVMGKLNIMLTNERKRRLKLALSEG